METPKESTPCIPSEKNSMLIGEVRKFPSLYDTSDPNYYVLAERNKAWLQVAANCNEPADLCHLRWKSLRKRFAKEKRRIPEILQGRRRPWALFPKMSFLTPTNSKRKPVNSKVKPKQNKFTSVRKKSFKQNPSDDEMLIVDDNDEIVHTCKSMEMSEEDEYIYETLDDPDSALEMMKDNPAPKVKQTAIRSGGSVQTPKKETINVSTMGRCSSSGRIRKLTPKMQNSFIAKKLKQAQQILQQSNENPDNTSNEKVVNTKDKIPGENTILEKTVLYQDKTTRHVATVNPNIIRVERIPETENSFSPNRHATNNTTTSPTKESPEGNRPFKVVKLKARNPLIFSPDQLGEIQSFLKSEASSSREQSDIKPMIKVKSVDHLNSQNATSSNSDTGETNLDIIHSVGLMRKTTMERATETEQNGQPSYSRCYSWNRPSAKVLNKQRMVTENIQPDSQTKDYEIEETWNDIKEENIDDVSWPQPTEMERHGEQHEAMFMNTQPDSANRVNIWNRLNEAKLELVAYQRKLLEEQHRKNLEYMKKEHDLKMTLLKAEIDLKRKQLNIML